MRKILVDLFFISIMIGGCSSQTNKKNTESDSTKNTVKENIFVNISDSKTHFPLYVGGASSSVEIDIPITKEIEKKVLENNKYETQYYIDFKLNDSDDKQILSVKGISWNIGDENPVIILDEYDVSTKQIKDIEENLQNETIRTSVSIYTNDYNSGVWKSLAVLKKKI